MLKITVLRVMIMNPYHNFSSIVIILMKCGAMFLIGIQNALRRNAL
jgi:hypothetical protein